MEDTVLHPVRRLDMSGALNFRDLGGYPTLSGGAIHWHRVYRSDTLSALTDADRDKLVRLGLYALCDYRLDDERERHPDLLPEGHDIKLHWPGFMPHGGGDLLLHVREGKLDVAGIEEELNRHYEMFATVNLPNYASTFDLIIEAQGRPVLVHCTSGKDRTGWAAALILLAAGCGDKTVEEDYILTDQYRRPLHFMFDSEIDAPRLEALMRPRRRYIRTALQRLRSEHGPGDGWLAALGFDAPSRKEIRRLLATG